MENALAQGRGGRGILLSANLQVNKEGRFRLLCLLREVETFSLRR